MINDRSNVEKYCQNSSSGKRLARVIQKSILNRKFYPQKQLMIAPKYLKKYSRKYLMRSCSEYISREWFSLRKINQYPKIKPDNFRSQPSEKQIDNDLEIDRKIFSKYYFVRDCNSPLSKINQNTSQNKAKENLNFLSKKKNTLESALLFLSKSIRSKIKTR